MISLSFSSPERLGISADGDLEKKDLGSREGGNDRDQDAD
jgi:hypothetical protein